MNKLTQCTLELLWHIEAISTLVYILQSYLVDRRERLNLCTGGTIWKSYDWTRKRLLKIMVLFKTAQ